MSQGSSVASGLVRVTIASGSRRVDLVLPGSIPVAELVPELARSVGLLDASTVYGGYRLVTQEGRILVNNAGLTMQGIEDGGLLTVTAGVDDKAPRVYDDVVEAMADVVENELKPWEPAAGRRTALGAGSVLQFLFDNGDSVFYADGIAAKDLAEPRFKKAASLRVTVDVAFPAAVLAATGGTAQTAPVGTAFAMPLGVRVTDLYGNGIGGVHVTFTVPASGASAVLSSTTVTTDANGAASVTAVANAEAGSYAVNAQADGVASPVAFSLTNTIDTSDVIFDDGFETPLR
jgi:hypothetical protein